MEETRARVVLAGDSPIVCRVHEASFTQSFGILGFLLPISKDNLTKLRGESKANVPTLLVRFPIEFQRHFG